MTAPLNPLKTSRRSVLTGGAALIVVRVTPLAADPSEMRDAIRVAVGDAPIAEGRVHLEIPALVENGNSVPLTIRVDSPMTPADHVTSIYVFSPENPLPSVSRFILGPRNGLAEVKTTIRLSGRSDKAT